MNSRELIKTSCDDSKILYFGKWADGKDESAECRYSNVQYNTCEFSFRGSEVKWIGANKQNQGYADVFLDEEFQATIDGYSAAAIHGVVKFHKSGLSNNRIHTLRIVVRKEKNADATDCCQYIEGFQSFEPVHYPTEIRNEKNAEYVVIKSGVKEFIPPQKWSPIAYAANSPVSGVSLGNGVFKDVYDRLILHLNDCFRMPSYCSEDYTAFKPYGGPGWSKWLPASNEGRMLAGAAGVLRWEERTDMREIVDTIVTDISSRMREDGYYNYYPESESYGLKADGDSLHTKETKNYEIVFRVDGIYKYYRDTDTYEFDTTLNLERKNYDRVFWSRGLLAAAASGDKRAYPLLRRMYDWFNASPYLGEVLNGPNATNGFPGGPLIYLSPVGVANDLIVTERYYDQEYWINELNNREPLCIGYYPGINPHCYELLGLEAFIDEYRATGAKKYIDAALGFWEIFKNSYMHTGGIVAICEGAVVVYSPKSYYITTGCTGETCGSVFWIYANNKLHQLFPEEEKYVAEIEQCLLNSIAAVQTSKGNIRYHSRLQGNKDEISAPGNTCCEVSSAGLIGRLPEFIYTLDSEGIYVNLYSVSTITWQQGGSSITLDIKTDFPYNPEVSIKIATTQTKAFSIRIRVPSWAAKDMTIKVNGSDFVLGKMGCYTLLNRTWNNGDIISFTLPVSFRMIKYTGLEQVEGNLDRYALMYGPVLMALKGELTGPGGIPEINVQPEKLEELLEDTGKGTLHYNVKGMPEYQYMPYWQIDTETFTCFPVVQA